MVKEVTIKTFNAIEDGATDWKILRDNFSAIQEVLNEHALELKALAKHQTFTISKMFRASGRQTLLLPGKHLRCKPVNAFAVMHDNIEAEVILSIVGLSQDLRFSDSEKKGSGKMFDLHPDKVVHWNDAVEVEISQFSPLPNNDRRVSVYVTFESIEEE